MRRILNSVLVLLCAALLTAAFGCRKEQGTQIDEDTAVLTVGDVPVYAIAYRHQLNERYSVIQKNKLYDWDNYLAYVVNPSIYYPFPYRDTRTEEGVKGLCADVLKMLSCEAASIYAAKQAGYQLSIQEQAYIEQAEQSASEALKEAAEDYGSVDAFYTKTGFTEQSFVRMYAKSKEASIDFGKLLEAYRESNPIDDAALAAGYERIVNETFRDRYADGMYAQYLGYYIMGARSFPSLYIPDDAIFVRLFVHTDPDETQIVSYTERAEQDFDALYMSGENEFTAQGTAGDLAVAPKDSLIDGLYDAAKDVPVGQIGTMQIEQDGKTVFYLFLRVEGETGVVPIDRYPGVRERIVSQLVGTFCTDTLLELINDPSVTVRNEALIDSIVPGAENAEIGS